VQEAGGFTGGGTPCAGGRGVYGGWNPLCRRPGGELTGGFPPRREPPKRAKVAGKWREKLKRRRVEKRPQTAPLADPLADPLAGPLADPPVP